MKKLLFILICFPLVAVSQRDMCYEVYQKSSTDSMLPPFEILINSNNMLMVNYSFFDSLSDPLAPASCAILDKHPIDVSEITYFLERYLLSRCYEIDSGLFAFRIKDKSVLIYSMGDKNFDMHINRIVKEVYLKLNISPKNRTVCFTKSRKKYNMVSKTVTAPPPPPPPPQEIEIVEDEVEIEEEELMIEDVELMGVSDDIFHVVEQMPEFPGGDLALMQFIQKNVRYPPIAKEYNIYGKVYVRFVVEKDGSISNVEIVRGVDENLDEEALRVVKSLPKFKPGKQRGKPARVNFTIPINFTLN